MLLVLMLPEAKLFPALVHIRPPGLQLALHGSGLAGVEADRAVAEIRSPRPLLGGPDAVDRPDARGCTEKTKSDKFKCNLA